MAAIKGYENKKVPMKGAGVGSGKKMTVRDNASTVISQQVHPVGKPVIPDLLRMKENKAAVARMFKASQ